MKKYAYKEGGKHMIVLLLILSAAVYTDYRRGIVPNWIIVFGIVSGLFKSFINGGLEGFLFGIAATVLPIVLLYVIFMIGALGAGDLKLFSVVGSFLGVKGVLVSLCIAFVIGAIISIIKMIRYHNFKERIYYFISYIADVVRSGKWTLYDIRQNENSTKSLSEDFPKHKIHFSMPILFGTILYMGGIF